jgi:hypothetical protein
MFVSQMTHYMIILPIFSSPRDKCYKDSRAKSVGVTDSILNLDPIEVGIQPSRSQRVETAHSPLLEKVLHAPFLFYENVTSPLGCGRGD